MSQPAVSPSLIRLNTLILLSVDLNPEGIQFIFEQTSAAHAFQAFPSNWVFLYDSFGKCIMAMGTEWELPAIGIRNLLRKVKMTAVGDDGPMQKVIILQVHDLAFVENPKTQFFSVKFSLDVLGIRNLNELLTFDKIKNQISSDNASSIFNVLNGTMIYEDFKAMQEHISTLKYKCMEELDHTKSIIKFNEEPSFADYQKENMGEGEVLNKVTTLLTEYEDRLVDGLEKMQLTYEGPPIHGVKRKHNPSRFI